MTGKAVWDRERRPASYWVRAADSYLASRPKGTVRRELLKHPEATLADPDWLAQEALDDADRADWGRIHPSMMGGEYLPDLAPEEVEIARIEMQSVTGDVISLRASHGLPGVVRYRLCDEYPEDNHQYSFVPVQTPSPLSFGEVADLLDHATVAGTEPGYDRVIWGVLAFNTDQGSGDPREVEHFIRVVSPFYPELTQYFEWRIRQWIAGVFRERRSLERTRLLRLTPFKDQIDAIVERECSARSWSGRYGGMGRGLFRQKRRRELEEQALTTGRLPEDELSG